MLSRTFGVGVLLLLGGLVVIATTAHHTRNIGLWVGVVGVILILYSGVVNAANLWRLLSDRKRCPDCAKSVPDEARVCRYCGHRFQR